MKTLKLKEEKHRPALLSLSTVGLLNEERRDTMTSAAEAGWSWHTEKPTFPHWLQRTFIDIILYDCRILYECHGLKNKQASQNSADVWVSWSNVAGWWKAVKINTVPNSISTSGVFLYPLLVVSRTVDTVERISRKHCLFAYENDLFRMFEFELIVSTGTDWADGRCAAGEGWESTEPCVTAQTTRGAPEAGTGVYRTFLLWKVC